MMSYNESMISPSNRCVILLPIPSELYALKQFICQKIYDDDKIATDIMGFVVDDVFSVSGSIHLVSVERLLEMVSLSIERLVGEFRYDSEDPNETENISNQLLDILALCVSALCDLHTYYCREGEILIYLSLVRDGISVLRVSDDNRNKIEDVLVSI